jgi:hypothetical protein
MNDKVVNDKEKPTVPGENDPAEWTDIEEDGDYLAQSGDEPNYRMKDGVMESITRPDEQIHKAGRLYFEKVWYYRCYLRNVEEYEQGLTTEIAGEAAAEKLRQSRAGRPVYRF